MEFTANLALSVLALLVSIAAAFYAKRAADQAAIANKVSLYAPRKAIYESAVKFRHLFGEWDLHPTDDEIQHFYIEAVLPAAIALPRDLYEDLYDAYKSSMEYYRRIELAESGESEESKWVPINSFKDDLTKRFDELIPKLIGATDVGNT